MTVKQLKSEAKRRGFVGYSKLRKQQLLELLERGPQSVELPTGWRCETKTDSIGRNYKWFISPDGKRFRRLPTTTTQPPREASKPQPKSTAKATATRKHRGLVLPLWAFV